MSSHRPKGAPSLSLALTGLVAIPVVSVTAAARISATASQAEASHGGLAIVALLGGFVAGLFVRQLIATVDGRVRGVFQLAAGTAQSISVPSDAALGWVRLGHVADFRSHLAPVAIRRRGPPGRIR